MTNTQFIKPFQQLKDTVNKDAIICASNVIEINMTNVHNVMKI